MKTEWTKCYLKIDRNKDMHTSNVILHFPWLNNSCFSGFLSNIHSAVVLIFCGWTGGRNFFQFWSPQWCLSIFVLMIFSVRHLFFQFWSPLWCFSQKYLPFPFIGLKTSVTHNCQIFHWYFQVSDKMNVFVILCCFCTIRSQGAAVTDGVVQLSTGNYRFVCKMFTGYLIKFPVFRKQRCLGLRPTSIARAGEPT